MVWKGNKVWDLMMWRRGDMWSVAVENQASGRGGRRLTECLTWGGFILNGGVNILGEWAILVVGFGVIRCGLD